MREIEEEIGINVQNLIKEDQVIKIETMKNKFVTLYLIRDIDENSIKLRSRIEI